MAKAVDYRPMRLNGIVEDLSPLFIEKKGVDGVGLFAGKTIAQGKAMRRPYCFNDIELFISIVSIRAIFINNNVRLFILLSFR